MKHRLAKLGQLTAILTLTAAPVAQAYEWNDIQFGGFFSQGYLQSSANDYLGETSDGTFDFREYALNASYAQGKWRVGAQVFAQKLGEYGDDEISLDWATVDYQATQWFGLRAGRVKMPRGLYNEALDLDMLRPFVLLPQSVYDARLRDFNSAFNGGLAYGNVGIGSFGSLDYKVFYGDMDIDLDSGANDYFNNDIPFRNTAIGMDAVYGGTLFWNTPVMGLRFGYSYSAFDTMNQDRIVPTEARPGQPAGVLNMFKRGDPYERHLLSAEYVRGDWVFAAEAGRESTIYDIGIKGTANVLASFDFTSTYGYVSATRRLNNWVELGGYYSYSLDEQVPTTSGLLPVPDLEQNDFAVSARFNLTDYAIFKLEAHYISGAGKIFSTPDKLQPLDQRDESWMLFAGKLTLFF